MSCAYRHAAARIATIAGIPRDLMLTAMDIARQRRITFPALPPDRLRTIAPRLGISSTCGNPQQVIARIQSALLALGTLHPSQAWVERGMAIAAALGVPDDHLPVPVHPEIMATVRAQWAAPPPNPAPDRATAGIAALWRGDPIPAELIEEALRTGDRQAIVTWIAHGVWDDRFTKICRRLTDAEIETIIRAGVVPDAVVERVAQRWTSRTLPWDIFPLAMWDRVADPEIARWGSARTAATKLIRDPALRDERLIAAAAAVPSYAHDVLVNRPDLRDNCLIEATAAVPSYASDVLIKRHDLSDDRLIEAVAGNAACARDVLIKRHDLSDDRLIAAVATDAAWARDVLIARHDLSDDRLIAAVVKDPAYVRTVLLARPDLRTETRLIEAAADPDWWAYDVLIKHPDRYTDERLITVAAQHPSRARDVLLARTDVSDERLIEAVARDAAHARTVLCARRDLRNPSLIAAAAKKSQYALEVLIARHDLSDEHLIAAVTDNPWDARNVLRTRADLRTNTRLLTVIARHRSLVDNVLTQYPDLRDHPILAAVRGSDGSSG